MSEHIHIVTLKGFSVSTKKDIALEKGLFDNRARFFEDVFSVRPVIRQREF